MTANWIGLIRKVFVGEQPVDPIDRGLARQWIKRRLASNFPELRGDPEALHRAYHQLGLEPTGVVQSHGEVQSFEMSLPEIEEELRNAPHGRL